MTAFRTLDDLRASLDRAGLGALAGPIVASARPTILFLRIQAPDDALPTATSKIGGHPDLPENFAWPTRPPFPKPRERAEAEAQSIRDVGAFWSTSPFALAQPFDYAAATESYAQTQLGVAEARGETFAEAFPLGFVGQFNLETLAAEPGFDPALPRTGLLAVFEDVTAEPQPGVPVVHWFADPPEKLRRRAPPETFIRHFERCGPLNAGAAELWAEMTFAETLVPFSGVSVPYHWRSLIPPESPDWERLNDWWYSEADDKRLVPTPPSFEGHGPRPPQASAFDDRLGGWPNPIQDDPENNIDDRRITAIGQAPFRHIVTCGDAFLGGTRRMRSYGKGDGVSYHLIAPEDLAARRFELARCVSHSD